MKYTTNSAVAICVGIAMVWLVGCARATHVTETTTTSEYGTANPPVTAPVANSNAATTQHDKSTAQGTYKPPDQHTPIRWSGTRAFYVE